MGIRPFHGERRVAFSAIMHKPLRPEKTAKWTAAGTRRAPSHTRHVAAPPPQGVQRSGRRSSVRRERDRRAGHNMTVLPRASPAHGMQGDGAERRLARRPNPRTHAAPGFAGVHHANRDCPRSGVGILSAARLDEPVQRTRPERPPGGGDVDPARFRSVDPRVPPPPTSIVSPTVGRGIEVVQPIRQHPGPLTGRPFLLRRERAPPRRPPRDFLGCIKACCLNRFGCATSDELGRKQVDPHAVVFWPRLDPPQHGRERLPRHRQDRLRVFSLEDNTHQKRTFLSRRPRPDPPQFPLVHHTPKSR